MAPDEAKPNDPKPEEPKTEAAAPTPPAEPEAPKAAEPAAAPTPPVDSMKQMEDAARQASASIDKAFQGQSGGQLRLIIAIVLGVIGAGWGGAMVNGQVMKGVALLVGGIVLAMICRITCFGLFLILPWYLFTLIDTIMLALKVSRGEKLGDWEFCWGSGR
ncbi:MAG TPA: hypothetical protein VKT78_01975 [Fimbriimonadaceae bacterium]|nr:hypothetical protein [Fimbriimonadaceae bacterium]